MSDSNKMPDVPDNWEIVKIKNIGKVITGSTPKTSEERYYANEGYLWASPADLGKGKYVGCTTKRLTTEGFQQTRQLPPNSILVTCIGSTIGKIGMSQYYMATNQQINSIICDDDKNPAFFYYVLQSMADYIKSLAGTHAVPLLNKTDFSEIGVIRPPLAEQQKIAEILTTVDEKIDVINAQITQTQELKKGLMQRLLTKGIGHTTFKESPLGEIPDSWEVLNGEEISLKITKGASPNWQGFDYQRSGVLFITSENVRDGRLDISSPKYLPIEFNEKQKNSTLKEYDVLINIVGASIGRACLFTCYTGTANVNQAVCVFRLKGNYSPFFILYYLQHSEVIKRLLDTQAGSARQNLSLATIRSFNFLIPKYDEQQKIASIMSSVDEKLEVLQEKKSGYQQLKKGLMQQLLTGKIRVNHLIETEVFA